MSNKTLIATVKQAFRKINSCWCRGYQPESEQKSKSTAQPSPWRDGVWNLKYSRK